MLKNEIISKKTTDCGLFLSNEISLLKVFAYWQVLVTIHL